MSSPFHPRSVKPSVSNPEFTVFRAPFPMLAIRHIDVRDIAFVGVNERAFKRYHALFSKLFERGAVSNEFGHVTGYLQACERFGFSAQWRHEDNARPDSHVLSDLRDGTG
jgi:hypothetical protein